MRSSRRPSARWGAHTRKNVVAESRHELILSVPPKKSSSRFQKPCTTLLLDATLSMGVEDGVKPPSDGAAAVKTSPVGTALIVALYLALNSSLNLLNRYTLGHAGSNTVSPRALRLVFQICSSRRWSSAASRRRRTQTVGRLWKALAAIGAFMSLNIALNNASLLHLSLSINQVIRVIPSGLPRRAARGRKQGPFPGEAHSPRRRRGRRRSRESADKSKQRPDETIGVVFCVVAATLSKHADDDVQRSHHGPRAAERPGAPPSTPLRWCWRC